MTIVTGDFVITVCMVILLYEAKVADSLLGNHRFGVWTAVLDLWQGVWGLLSGPTHWGSSCNKSRMLLILSSTQPMSQTVNFSIKFYW